LTGPFHVLQLQLSPALSHLAPGGKIENRDILVPPNPGPPGKTAIKTTERVVDHCNTWIIGI